MSLYRSCYAGDKMKQKRAHENNGAILQEVLLRRAGRSDLLRDLLVPQGLRAPVLESSGPVRSGGQGIHATETPRSSQQAPTERIIVRTR